MSFFATYPNFDHDPTAPLLSEFDRLSQAQNWTPGSKKYRKRRNTCLKAEFAIHFPAPCSQLSSWQAFCLEVGIRRAPGSINKCKRALSGIHLNVVDLIDAQRTGNGPVQKFRTKDELQEYTESTERWFPKNFARENALLRTLLKTMD